MCILAVFSRIILRKWLFYINGNEGLNVIHVLLRPRHLTMIYCMRNFRDSENTIYLSYHDENMRERQEINYFVEWTKAKCHITVFQWLFSALKSQSGTIFRTKFEDLSVVLIAVSSNCS